MTEVIKPNAIQEVEQKFINEMSAEGYTFVRHVEGWGYCGIRQNHVTTDVVHGVSYFGIEGCFCFDTLSDALDFFVRWDGKAVPVVGENGCRAFK